MQTTELIVLAMIALSLNVLIIARSLNVLITDRRRRRAREARQRQSLIDQRRAAQADWLQFKHERRRRRLINSRPSVN